MSESLIQVGMMIALFVFLRVCFKKVIPHIFFKHIWIACALKLWIPISISLPWGVHHASTFIEVYQPQVVSIQPISTDSYMLQFIWLSVSILLLIFYTIQYWRIKQIVDCAIPLDKDTYVSDYITSPFAFGIWKCKIIVPKNMDNEILSYVMLHENMHKRCFDNGWKLFMLLTCCVFWFHPMVWVLRYALNVDSEIVCDQRVVKTLSSHERQRYAHSILACAGMKREITSSFCSQFTSHYYKERIKNIMKYKKTTAFTFAVSCVLAGGIISVCANNDEIYTGDAQSTQSTSDSETTMLSQEEKFDILSNCTTREEYTDLYMELFSDSKMIYLFTEDFPEGTLPYK